jgi:APA family basic amino acid/polyamine antiporter
MTTAPVSAPEDGLERRLNWIDAAAIFVGIILGSGIFEAPAAVAGATGDTTLGASLWILGALVAAAGAFCYAECGARVPRTGGFFVYYREAYGEGVAFVGGWAALLITYPASLAAIAHICARYAGALVPELTTTPFRTAATAASAILLAGGLNVLGVRTGANTQRLLTGFKVLALALLCVAALAGAPTVTAAPPVGPLFPGGLGAVLGAMVILLWTFDGWSDVTLIGGELKDPGRDFGKTVVLGVAVLLAVYALVQVAVMHLLGATAAGASKQVVADAVGVGIGPQARRMVAALVVVCTFGSLHAVVLTSSRLAFAMANQGVFLRFFSQVQPRLGTPARSIVALVVASLVYVFVANFRNLLAFFSFNVWIFYAATAVALLLLRHRGVGEPPAWRAPGGVLAPAVVLVTALAMTTSLLLQDPLRASVGLGMLAMGIPLYLAWRALRRVP